MWNMFMPPYYPYPPYTPTGDKHDDPLRMLRKFRKFLKAEEGKDDKKKDKGKVDQESIRQLGLLLLLGMPITGPLYILCMIVMWKLVKMNLQ